MTASTGHRRTPSWRPLAPSLLLAVLVLVGCGGGSTTEDPEDALAGAKKALDDTSGVTISLETATLPDGVDGILEANGVGTHAPAFDGELAVSVDDLSVKVPVVAVEGKVFAKLPFTQKFVDVDPGDYGAPDPADLMDPAGGISAWLTAATGVEAGEQVREGDKVLTTYDGTVPGTAIADVIPSADSSARFPATFRVDDDGRLDSADISGPFYGDQGTVDYTLTLSGYGTQQDITAP